MVSKIIKSTPTKPSKPSPAFCRHHHHHRRKKSSPLKSLASAPSAVIASIDRSIRTCRRRLIKLFSCLTTLGSTTPVRRKHGFRRLKAIHDEYPVPIDSITLPPLSPPGKRTVFLDLDETLVHSQTGPPPEKYDFMVRPIIDGQIMTFYVLKRPGIDELLEEVSKSFEVVIFTAGLKEYASLVLDRLDPMGKTIAHRLYRDSCRGMEGRFVKDLAAVGRDLDRAVIIDDNPNAYLFQPENAVPVSPFIDNLADRELHRVMKFFEVAAMFEDMRDAVKQYLSDGDEKAHLESTAAAAMQTPPSKL